MHEAFVLIARCCRGKHCRIHKCCHRSEERETDDGAECTARSDAWPFTVKLLLRVHFPRSKRLSAVESSHQPLMFFCCCEEEESS